MEKFSLEGRPYVELKNLIKLLQFTNSGGETKIWLAEGNVKLNGEIETRRGKKLYVGDELDFPELKVIIEE